TLFERIVDAECPKTVQRLQIQWEEFDLECLAPYGGSGGEEENNNNDQGGTSQVSQATPSRPTLDPIKLQRFFSQFIDICWVLGEECKPDWVISSAHGRLQSIRLSWGLSERELYRFISSCSSALVVANLVDLPVSDENLPLLGGTCPHLRALFMMLDDVSDVAFQSFLGMVGVHWSTST
ncbi:hypothetical protein HK102_005154, partial [Quaeritorhiza haematococci]